MFYPTDLQHVCLYLRKSRADIEAEARGEGETLAKHRRALMKLAKQYRYGIDDVYEEVVSGERIIERPEVQRLLAAVEEGRYDAVLCVDTDRIGRGNKIDQGIIQETFKTSKTLIITLRKVYNLDDETDEEFLDFESFMAHRELRVITRRMQRGRRQSAAEGRSITKHPPYGYSRDENLKLIPDPETAPIVRRIFELSAEGLGMAGVANYLTDHGIKTPGGKDTWERSSVHWILKNPVYRGHIVWGRMQYKKATGNRKGYIRERQSQDQWIMHEHAHEPLVDELTYARYLDRAKKLTRVSNGQELSNPLASLVYCVKCGRTMRRQPRPNRPYNHFRCATYGCTTKGTRFETVEEKVLDTLRTILGNMTASGRVFKRVPKTDNPTDMIKMQVTGLQKELGELEIQRGSLHDLLERGVYTIDVFLERNRILGERIEAVTTQRDRAVHELDEAQKEKPVTNIVPALTKVIQSYDRAKSAKRKNELLKTVIERIEYRRESDWKELDRFELEIHLRQ